MPPGDNPLMNMNVRQLLEQADRPPGTSLEEIMDSLRDGSAALKLVHPGGAQSSPDRVVSLEDGTGEARAARVTSDNNLGAESRYGRTEVVTDTVVLTVIVSTLA